jgi:hypothetical protein
MSPSSDRHTYGSETWGGVGNAVCPLQRGTAFSIGWRLPYAA